MGLSVDTCDFVEQILGIKLSEYQRIILKSIPTDNPYLIMPRYQGYAEMYACFLNEIANKHQSGGLGEGKWLLREEE